tara:strand:- start:1037 stop:1480 length:444 start_codon:yes stop_codon:yes gene_type:complete
MPKRKKKKEEPLGPVATRFSEYLDTGLHEFDKCFQDYAPYYVQHLDLGKGLLFSQSPVDKDAGQSLKDSLIVCEDGIAFTTSMDNSKEAKVGILFNNEQPPEKVVLLVLAAMVKEEPLQPYFCDCCKEEEEEDRPIFGDFTTTCEPD